MKEGVSNKDFGKISSFIASEISQTIYINKFLVEHEIRLYVYYDLNNGKRFTYFYWTFYVHFGKTLHGCYLAGLSWPYGMQVCYNSMHDVCMNAVML